MKSNNPEKYMGQSGTPFAFIQQDPTKKVQKKLWTSLVFEMNDHEGGSAWNLFDFFATSTATS